MAEYSICFGLTMFPNYLCIPILTITLDNREYTVLLLWQKRPHDLTKVSVSCQQWASLKLLTDNIRELRILTKSVFRSISIRFCPKQLKQFFVDLTWTLWGTVYKFFLPFFLCFATFLPVQQITRNIFVRHGRHSNRRFWKILHKGKNFILIFLFENCCHLGIGLKFSYATDGSYQVWLLQHNLSSLGIILHWSICCGYLFMY